MFWRRNKKWIRWTLGVLVGAGMVCIGFVWWLAQKPVPAEITYGMSFNTLYARELGLNWRTTYDALLDDLGVRQLRLAAHWPMVEPERDNYNFAELDYQLQRAQAEGAAVVFAVGRRLPRWPECHVPKWATALSEDERQAEILEYIERVVERYQDSPAITHWQVENEPYLEVFAREHCGELDEEFLREEIALVKSLDPSRPVLVTDSGNLGTWFGAYREGDAFGTSVYLHFWNPELGQFRTVLPSWWYRVKENVMALLYGKQDVFLIELAAEPWLVAPITDVSIETQLTRMNVQKFEETLDYARATRLEKQYLWGGEWWYWLKLQGYPQMWQRGKELF